MGRQHKWGVRCLVGAVVATGLTFTTGAKPALAVGDLSYKSSATYTVDPAGSVHVVVDLTFTNTARNTAQFYYYYDTVFVPVTANAANLLATRSGGRLSARVSPRNRFVSDVQISLSPRLLSGQTQQVRLTYDIPSSGARVEGINRINPAYMTFVAFAPGDPGNADVTLRVPSQYDVELGWESLDRASEGDFDVYRSGAIDDPDSFAVSVAASDDSRLSIANFKVKAHPIRTRAWPDDPLWARFVKTKLSSGIPVLERLLGESLPDDSTLVVTETATPYIYGYAGWYSSDRNTIEIGDQLDADVILHEVSHAWFNSKEFSDRWVNEGFAEEFGTRAVDQTNGDLRQPDHPKPLSESAVVLNDWGNPDFDSDDSDAEEAYGYNAAFYVMRTISNEIGPDKMRAVMQSAFDNELAYGVRDKRDEQTQAFTWKQMLDAFEIIGGSKDASELFERYVVTGAQKSALTDRRKALDDYTKLVELGDDWAAPRTVRNSMESWTFATARTQMSEATEILKIRDEIRRDLDQFDLTMPIAFRDEFEAANSTGLDAVKAHLIEFGHAVDGVKRARDAVDADRSIWQRVGLVGADTDGLLGDASRALEANKPDVALTAADQATDIISESGRIGAWRLIKLGGALLGLLFVLWCCHLVFKQRREAEEALHSLGA